MILNTFNDSHSVLGISIAFFRRLACCGDAEMRRFLLEAESALFQCRVSCMNAQELTALVRPLRKYSGEHKYYRVTINKDSTVNVLICVNKTLKAHHFLFMKVHVILKAAIKWDTDRVILQ